LGQGQQAVAQVGEAERRGAENAVQELSVPVEESDRVGLLLWREVLHDDLFGFLSPGSLLSLVLPLSSSLLSLHGLHVLQGGGAAPI
jgi:hypothetical protein